MKVVKPFFLHQAFILGIHHDPEQRFRELSLLHNKVEEQFFKLKKKQQEKFGMKLNS